MVSSKIDIPKTAIIGATGFIGRHLYQSYQEHHPGLVGTSRDPRRTDMPYLDLRRPRITSLRLKETGHTQALILAAEPNVMRCETHRRTCYGVNVTGTLKLIDQLLEAGIFPIFASTDYVFPGDRGNYTEEDATGPTTAYGAQKEEVEKALMEKTAGEALILRFSKIYDIKKGDKTLFDEMARNFAEEKVVRAAYDQAFNPMYIGDVAPALFAVQKAEMKGIVHICGDEARTRLSMARSLARAMGVTNLIEKIAINQLSNWVNRPTNTSMCNHRLRSIYKEPMMDIDACIDKVSANYKLKTFAQATHHRQAPSTTLLERD